MGQGSTYSKRRKRQEDQRDGRHDPDCRGIIDGDLCETHHIPLVLELHSAIHELERVLASGGER